MSQLTRVDQVLQELEDGRVRVRSVNDQPEVTKQSFREECDINNIIRQFQRTGVVRHLNEARASFADISELGDFHDAIALVELASESFMELPAKVRKVFDHDPAKFLDAAHDPEKRYLLEAAGLIPAERPEDEVQPPPEVPAVPEPE